MHTSGTLVRRRARRGGAMAGCLIALGIVVVILIGAGIFVAMNFKGWAVAAVETVTIQAINESDLDEAEKGEVIAEVKAVTHAFKEGDITMEDATNIFEEIAKSPIAPAAIVFGINAEYFAPSGLSDEEKAAGNQAIGRVARGVYEKKIDPDKLNEIFKPIATTATAGKGVHINTDDFRLNLKSPDDVTDEELREVVALAVAEAETAEIPDEPYEIDASEEIAKAVERAIGRRLEPVHDRP